MMAFSLKQAAGGAASGAYRLAPEALVEAYEGPALLVGGDGRVIYANGMAILLVGVLDGAPGSPMHDALACCLVQGCPAVAIQSVDTSQGKRIFEVTFIPLLSEAADGGHACALALGREKTFETNLTHTLIESRERYRDLVNGSSDFVWETNRDGILIFVSRGGALGFSADQLNQRRAATLLDPDFRLTASPAFETRDSVYDQELWLRDAAGEPVCMLVSAVPLFKGGVWKGARGICRDVTEARRREAALEQARSREKMLGEIIAAIRDVIDPGEMLGNAARATAQGLGAAMCWVMRADQDGLTVEASHGVGDHSADDLLQALARRMASRDDEVVALARGGVEVLAAFSHHQGRLNGAIGVARPAQKGGWSDDERALLRGVADHLSIAMAQIANHQKLTELSRTDELTGLANRRAFGERAQRHINHQRRTGAPGALLYIDLDNFKLVNDRYGHERGDRLLCALADILTRTSRADSDIPARLGGDEFALWLENADRAGAVKKARALLDCVPALRHVAGETEQPCSLSIGIALSRPDEAVRLADLLSRADAAMYRAKKQGKAAFAIWEDDEEHRRP
jgi:diguanylate cyclase (GGDEF)-like protein/PAS domain S-box-containing protein